MINKTSFLKSLGDNLLVRPLLLALTVASYSELANAQEAQTSLAELHKPRYIEEGYEYDANDPYSYLMVGDLFRPTLLKKPESVSFSEDKWKKLSGYLANDPKFSSPEKLEQAVKDLSAMKPPGSDIAFQALPRLMAFFMTKPDLSQADLNQNKDLVFLISQDNYKIRSEFKRANLYAHSDYKAPKAPSGPEVNAGKSAKAAEKKQKQHQTVNDYLNSYSNSLLPSKEDRQEFNSALKKMGFDLYTSHSPLTYIQMYRDYKLMNDKAQFNKIVSDFEKRYGTKPKLNLRLNVHCKSSSDWNGAFANSMYSAESAWESLLKYSDSPIAVGDDKAISLVLGVRGDEDSLYGILDKIRDFVDDSGLEANFVNLNFLAHGQLFSDTNKSYIALVKAEELEGDKRLLSSKDEELFEKLKDTFAPFAKGHNNFTVCFSGQGIAGQISEAMYDGMQENKKASLSYSAPFEQGHTHEYLNEEGFTEYENGLAIFRFKNYFPKKGIVEESFPLKK